MKNNKTIEKNDAYHVQLMNNASIIDNCPIF